MALDLKPFEALIKETKNALGEYRGIILDYENALKGVEKAVGNSAGRPPDKQITAISAALNELDRVKTLSDAPRMTMFADKMIAALNSLDVTLPFVADMTGTGGSKTVPLKAQPGEPGYALVNNAKKRAKK